MGSPLWLVRETALRIAGRSSVHASYARTLRHIATDCQAAIDGCPASLESVTEYLAQDDQLDTEVSRAWRAFTQTSALSAKEAA